MTGRLFRSVTRFLSDPRGGVSAMLALMLIPMIGVFGMGAEASSWYLIQRAAQNAADSSAMAAASNGCEPGKSCETSDLSATYVGEATSVAKQLGFQNDAATIVATTKVNCPGGTKPECYQVAITRKIPIHLVRVVGFNGDTTLAGSPAQTVFASAIAKPKASTSTFCLLALGTGTSITAKGNPKADMSGCKVGTNGTADCRGHDLKADEVDAVGTSNCAASTGVNANGSPVIADPYAALASNIKPPGSCPAFSGTFPTNPGASLCYTGNVPITGTTTITTPAGGTVLYIKDGNLVVNGTLQTALNSGLTIVLYGTTGTHILAGSGTLDIAAPASGSGSVWSGVAVYQDPSMTSGVDFSAAGNSPTWKITGLIYLPNANTSFSGIVNKASNGQDCFALVVKTFETNGTSTILEHQTQCASAGLNPPAGGASIRQALVQ